MTTCWMEPVYRRWYVIGPAWYHRAKAVRLPVSEMRPGDRIEYWRCGDDNCESVVLPQKGETFATWNATLPEGEEYPWERVSKNTFKLETAVGDTNGSKTTYRMK